ncbi:phosphoribosylformylglycinamidine synthase subunit PurL [Fructobacillus ficulneus]|uniref:Phosphoribosylformylglycinamidine synthase subunit PurL n=1 Tax=Fructobacillus ficulneus TaxID=157463 RepID=A0A0K8MG55_9LACO|nr:phosphoribosylformylglycinamidine synthase subunit PurL [Fructobacillus ficulneus]GAO99490.1 phosphoribosylformylglycinamidine synthase II [Fructobacillus ficulneus]
MTTENINLMAHEPSPDQIAADRIYADWGLTDHEYDLIVKQMGRRPNYTETGIFSGMWSEHCSYKKSKPALRKFWSKNDRVLQGPGEGAGILDIGDGQAVVFKAESHNHPSFVEPYEGAATGVGGILRDIFSMGAQPIAVLDSLRFGELTSAKTRNLVDGVIAGIAGYGNAIGIPNLGGEIGFDDTYAGNPLVNVMSVGLVNQAEMQVGQAKGTGNTIIYVGAKTGRDGINGASFASAEFSSTEESDRSAVQVGDPFLEKLVMDATIDAIRQYGQNIIGIQDMGAAGLLSSSSEMASKAGTGIELDLDLVPQREAALTPYELMLSESQERMLLVVQKGQEQPVIDLFAKAGLDAVAIGQVTDDGRYRLNFQGETVADVDIDFLTNAPEPQLDQVEPSRIKEADAAQYQPVVDDPSAVLADLLAQPTIASKASLFRHFDSQVRADTVIKPGGDAGVSRIRGTKKALAMTTDVNSRFAYLNPRVGGQMAVAEAGRNLVATGALPIGMTDCLNFGSPDNPEVYYELHQAVEGITEMAKALNTPVISGNVSLYNETDNQAIMPTAMVGMVGLIEDNQNITRANFQAAGDKVYLVGQTADSFNGSEIQKMQTGTIAGQLFDFDQAAEMNNQGFVLAAIQAGLVQSAHDLSEGGLAVALAEATFTKDLGLDVNFAGSAAQLFSETSGRFILSVAAENVAAFEEIIAENQARVVELGTVTADQTIKITATDGQIDLATAQAKDRYQNAIPQLMAE